MGSRRRGGLFRRHPVWCAAAAYTTSICETSYVDRITEVAQGNDRKFGPYHGALRRREEVVEGFDVSVDDVVIPIGRLVTGPVALVIWDRAMGHEACASSHRLEHVDDCNNWD